MVSPCVCRGVDRFIVRGDRVFRTQQTPKMGGVKVNSPSENRSEVSSENYPMEDHGAKGAGDTDL